RTLKELPPRLKTRFELGNYYSLPPISWSNISYYQNQVSYLNKTKFQSSKFCFLIKIHVKQILPLLLKHKVVHLNKTDSRLANNGLHWILRNCGAKALLFTSQIEQLGRKVITILKRNGPFLILHLRYETDMLAFSGCTNGCTQHEARELTRMRYAYPWWKEKVIDSDIKRQEGLCPLTHEETALTLTALGIDPNIQIYIESGEIYGGEKSMVSLATAFPNLVRKETLLDPKELMFFQNHSSQMATLDYMVSIESDIFVPTYDGNMAKILGIQEDDHLRKALIQLIDQYNDGSLSWNEFSSLVKEAHADRLGGPQTRTMHRDKPKEEDYYSNPHECLEQQNNNKK
ncbi:hypothetical protein V2J09_013366, partial [Rumex salicifolius]